jgi:hypothetical protein
MHGSWQRKIHTVLLIVDKIPTLSYPKNEFLSEEISSKIMPVVYPEKNGKIGMAPDPTLPTPPEEQPLQLEIAETVVESTPPPVPEAEKTVPVQPAVVIPAPVQPSAAVNKPAPLKRSPAPMRKSSAFPWGILLAAVTALIIGGVAGSFFTYQMNGYRAKWRTANLQLAAAQASNKSLDLELDKSRIELSNLRVGMSQMNKLFADQGQPPEKPNYQKLDKGIIIYWMDGLIWRHYYLYKGQGKNPLVKTSIRSNRKNFVVEPEVRPGVWNYAVTAVDRQGKETALSETLTIRASK